MRFEEIHISTIPPDFVEEQPPEPRVSNATLEQRNRFRFCKCAFELFNQRLLSVKIEGVFKHARDYEFDIGILDPEPKRSVRISWLYLSAFLILAATAGLTACTDLVPNSSMLSAMLGAGAGLSLILAAYRCHDRLVFYSQNGRVALVILLNRNPDGETFNTFTDALIRRIQQVRDSIISRSEMLSEELKEHRRLMEAGIISKKRYDSVKQRILRQHQHQERRTL
jgi:hypothetical protein